MPPPVLLRADARHLPIADDTVDLVVTSPPYFGLRSYQDACDGCRDVQFTGGDPRVAFPDWPEHTRKFHHYAGQIGAEPTPAEFVDALLDVTRECVRVLKPSGSLWVNLGDKYARPGGGADRSGRSLDGAGRGTTARRATPGYQGAPEKSLIGIPWRYALRCIDDLGLILRAEVIWAKPNGLPESVTDRVRRSHETWFHFTLSSRYFTAVDEVREEHLTPGVGGPRRLDGAAFGAIKAETADGSRHLDGNPLGKLPGSVWTIPTQPLSVPAHLGVDHFAAFPMEWPRRIIKGWSPSGICTACSEGRRPVVASVGLNTDRPQARRAQQLADEAGLTEAHFAALLSVGVSDTGRGAATQSGTGKNTPEVYALADEARQALGGYAREYLLRRPTGLTDACACPDTSAPTRPAVVLDPFGGTGTTALVASVLGRRGVSVDRSADYCRLARWRTTDPGQRAAAMQVDRPAAQAQGQLDMFGEAL